VRHGTIDGKEIKEVKDFEREKIINTFSWYLARVNEIRICKYTKIKWHTNHTKRMFTILPRNDEKILA
jgi:hypothetical protein